MPASRSRLLTLGVVAFAAAASLSRALAADEPERVQLAFHAPKSCPHAAAFAAEIMARTARVHIVTEGPTARSLRVRVSAADTGYAGELELVAPLGEPARRAFEDPDCREVVTALGLVAALALDPSASTAPRSAEPAQARPEPPVASSLEPGSAEPTGARAPPMGLPAAAAPTGPALGAPPPPPRPAAHRGWRAGAGAAGVLLWGPAPQPLVALAPVVEFELEHAPRSVLVMRLRLMPLLAQTGVIGSPADLAVFRLFGLRAELCPIGTGSGAFEVGVCARADVGALTVEGEGLARWERSSRPWTALGLGLDLGLHPAGLFRFSGGLAVPLVRDRFVVHTRRRGADPSVAEIHEPGPVGGTLGLLAGVRFP